MKIIAAALPLTLLLAACGGSNQPDIRTVTVVKPVPVSCVPATLAPPPSYPDADAVLRAAGGPDERYLLVVVGRALRVARLAEIEPIIEGCRDK